MHEREHSYNKSDKKRRKIKNMLPPSIKYNINDSSTKMFRCQKKVEGSKKNRTNCQKKRKIDSLLSDVVHE
jgi:hypothetical protein